MISSIVSIRHSIILTLVASTVAPLNFPAATAAPSSATPELIIEAPPPLEPLAERLRSIDPQRLERALRLVGSAGIDAPIRVVLAAEGTDLARRVPPWIAGFALTEEGTCVLFPGRVPSYPHSSLEEVYLHELTHVLAARAANHRSLPRWFAEGVAMIAGSPWGLTDRWHFGVALIADRRPSLAQLEQHFETSENAALAAYALSGAFVQHLLQRHGQVVVAAILRESARGSDFPQAFAAATGSTLAAAESSFWRRYTFWYRWLPILTSGATLWAAVTVLALLAIGRRRRRDAAQRQAWEEEEAAAAAHQGETLD